MLRSLALSLAGSLALTSCLVANPAPRDLPRGTTASAPVSDVAYGPLSGCTDRVVDVECGGSNLLDIYPATAGPSRGTILWIHGGSLFMGDKSDLTSADPVMAQLQRGWSVVSVNYRLLRPEDLPLPSTTTIPESTTTSTVPDEDDLDAAALVAARWTAASTDAAPSKLTNEFPSALEDVTAALRWVRSNGATHGLDTSRLIVSGHSAGGMLAAMIGLGWNSGLRSVARSDRPDAWVTMGSPMNFGSADTMAMINAWLGEAAQGTAGQLSPLGMIDSADPRGYVAHGDQDSVVLVHHALAAEWVFGLSNLAGRLRVDIVDFDTQGRSLGTRARWHLPGEGVNMRAFNEFIDAI